VITETIGEGQEAEVWVRTFSDDGFNLKRSESDRAGKVVTFSYIPGTNLPASEITYEDDRIVKRIFHFYV